MAKKQVNTDQEILAHYVKVGEFLAEMFVPYLKVAVYELRYP